MTSKFVYKWLPVVATLVGVILFAKLGMWQLDRAAEKTLMKEAYDIRTALPVINVAADLLSINQDEYRYAVVEGFYEFDKQILIDNKIINGRGGLDVITPIKIIGTDRRLLINRGWTPWSLDRTIFREFDNPKGKVVVRGLLKRPSQEYFTLSRVLPDASDQVWQNMDLALYSELKNVEIQPMLLLRSPDETDEGLERILPVYTDTWIDRHKGYALQWFAFGVIALMIFGYFRFYKRGKV